MGRRGEGQVAEAPGGPEPGPGEDRCSERNLENGDREEIVDWVEWSVSTSPDQVERRLSLDALPGDPLFGGRRLIYGFEQWLKGEKSIGYTLYNADTPLEKGKRVCIGADVADMRIS